MVFGASTQEMTHPGRTRTSTIPSGRCCAPTRTGPSKGTRATAGWPGIDSKSGFRLGWIISPSIYPRYTPAMRYSPMEGSLGHTAPCRPRPCPSKVGKTSASMRSQCGYERPEKSRLHCGFGTGRFGRGTIRTAAAFTADPARIMTLLNERLQGRGLVTCVPLRIDRDGSVILINAGHLPPYLNGTDLPIEGALPLGAVPGIDFSVLRFQLAEGDSLMLMSDGIAEAQNAAGQLFGFERIAEMLRQHTTAAGLATAAQAFGQEDDITVLTVARM